MKEEQYLRVVSINKKIEGLNETKRELRQKEKCRLSFLSRDSLNDYQMFPEWVIDPIKAILDKHDKMIRQEIDEEIKRLKKEIETL